MTTKYSKISEQINTHGVNSIITQTTPTEESIVDISNNILQQVDWSSEEKPLPNPLDGLHPKFRED